MEILERGNAELQPGFVITKYFLDSNWLSCGVFDSLLYIIDNILS